MSAEDGDNTAEVPALRPLSGIDLAKAALAQAREDARKRGAAPSSGSGGRKRRVGPAPARGDDPELLGAALSRFLAERGWDVPTAVAGVTERWAEVAGPEVAEHCRPESFTNGVLVLVAESTAWATQIRLLRPALQKRLDEVVGHGVVTKIEVRGPTGPDWRKGPLRVRGRGPRDTYG